MGEDRQRILEHSSNIFYHMAIGTMILCYLATIVFSFDVLSYFGLFFLMCFFGAIWVVVALLGAVTFLLAVDGFRAFLLDFGRFTIGLINMDNLDNITRVVMSLGAYYPIIAVLPPITIALTIILKALNKTLKGAKREIWTLSIMGAFYVVSLILSILLITKYDGGIA